MQQHLVLLFEQPQPAPQRDDIIRTTFRLLCRQTIGDIRHIHLPAQRVN